MVEFSVKPPTIPIPFHKLLKVVALADGQDPQTRELLNHITAEHFEIEQIIDPRDTRPVLCHWADLVQPSLRSGPSSFPYRP